MDGILRGVLSLNNCCVLSWRNLRCPPTQISEASVLVVKPKDFSSIPYHCRKVQENEKGKSKEGKSGLGNLSRRPRRVRRGDAGWCSLRSRELWNDHHPKGKRMRSSSWEFQLKAIILQLLVPIREILPTFTLPPIYIGQHTRWLPLVLRPSAAFFGAKSPPSSFK